MEILLPLPLPLPLTHSGWYLRRSRAPWTNLTSMYTQKHHDYIDETGTHELIQLFSGLKTINRLQLMMMMVMIIMMKVMVILLLQRLI